MRTTQKFFLAFLLGLAGCVIFRDVIIKAAVQKGIKTLTGLELNIGQLNIGLLDSKIVIRNLVLLNPKGFEERTMLTIPEIYVDYDWAALFKQTIHFRDIRIDLREFNLVRNRRGELNLNSLKGISRPREKTKQAEKKKAKKSTAAVQIDQLSLKIGKVVYKNFEAGDPPQIQTFSINIDEKYRDITNLKTLINLIAFKAVSKTSLSTLRDVNLTAIKKVLSITLGTAQKIMSVTAGAAKKSIQKTAETVSDAAKITGEKLKDSSGDLYNIVVSP